MKKAYKKPMLLLERFTLSQTIASNCGANLDFSMANHHTKETCGWLITGIELFADFGVCDFPTEGFVDICYNAPEGGYNIFSS